MIFRILQGFAAVQLPLKPPIWWLPMLSAETDTSVPLKKVFPLPSVVNSTP